MTELITVYITSGSDQSKGGTQQRHGENFHWAQRHVTNNHPSDANSAILITNSTLTRNQGNELLKIQIKKSRIALKMHL